MQKDFPTGHTHSPLKRIPDGLPSSVGKEKRVLFFFPTNKDSQKGFFFGCRQLEAAKKNSFFFPDN